MAELITYNNGIVTAPVSDKGVADLINAKSYDFGKIYVCNNINMWAKYKPTKLSVDTPVVADTWDEESNDWVINNNNRKGWWEGDSDNKVYNIPAISPSTSVFDLDALLSKVSDVWTWNKPTAAPYRLCDFMGYYHYAIPPLTMQMPDDTIDYRFELRFEAHINNTGRYGISYSDLNRYLGMGNFSDFALYLGLIILTYNEDIDTIDNFACYVKDVPITYGEDGEMFRIVAQYVSGQSLEDGYLPFAINNEDTTIRAYTFLVKDSSNTSALDYAGGSYTKQEFDTLCRTGNVISARLSSDSIVYKEILIKQRKLMYNVTYSVGTWSGRLSDSYYTTAYYVVNDSIIKFSRYYTGLNGTMQYSNPTAASENPSATSITAENVKSLAIYLRQKIKTQNFGTLCFETKLISGSPNAPWSWISTILPTSFGFNVEVFSEFSNGNVKGNASSQKILPIPLSVYNHNTNTWENIVSVQWELVMYNNDIKMTSDTTGIIMNQHSSCIKTL